jgi:predicted permease
MLDSFIQNVRFTLRTLGNARGFAAVAILSLALATGATTAIFGVIDAVLLRPLPAIAGQSRLVSLYNADARKPDSFSPLSWPDYEYYRDHAHALSGLMAYLRLPFRVRIGSRTDSISGELVSPNYFETLGVKARAGRLLSPASQDTEPVVVISGRLWRERFGASPAAIGKTLFVGGNAFTVIGVAAEDFRGVTLDWGRTPELWIPAAFYRQAEQHLASIDVLHAWGMQSFLTVGRLRDGVSLEQAAQEMRSWGARADADNPARAAIWSKNGLAWTLRTLPLSQARFWPGQREQILRIIVVLFAVVAGVLLIACANIASLLLTRAAEREREMAARLALGAGAGSMVRLLLTESLAIAVAGGAGGLAVAVACMRVLARFPRLFTIPLSLDLTLEPRVLMFTITLTAACCVAFGLAPLRYVLRTDLANALRSRVSGAGRPERGITLRRALLVSEFGLALILLVGAGLFLRTFQNAFSAGAFLHAGDLLLIEIEAPTEAPPSFFSELVERTRTLPGVRSAGLVFDLPMSGVHSAVDILVPQPGGAVKRNVDYNVVSPGFLHMAGALLLKGRDFETTDHASASPVAIVNEELAQRFWNGDAIGRQLQRNGTTLTIIGVVRDEARRSYRKAVAPCLYRPVAQSNLDDLNLVVQTDGNPMLVLPGIRKAVANLDPETMLHQPLTLGEYANTVLAQERLAAWCLGALAALAVLLAGVGLYGATSFSVSRRIPEIGVRMALGSTPARIVGVVLRGPAEVALAGLAAGAYGALVLARYARSLLYGVTETDWVAWLCGVLVLVLATLLAAAIPALRASRVDPARTLHAE